MFEFQSGAWSLVTQVSGLLYELGQYEGDVTASLTLEKVEYEVGGETRKFTKPVLEIGGAAE